MNKRVREIIKNVESHLTNNKEVNLIYLNTMSDKYINDPDAESINRELKRLIYRNLPNQLRERFESTVIEALKAAPPGTTVQDFIEDVKRMRKE